MKINGSVALVTGANGGIGRAFAEELLKRGAAKVYLAARNLDSLSGLLDHGDSRIVPLKLDVTDDAQIAQAVQSAKDVTLLINNAGFSGSGGAISASNLSAARQEMDVNYFGILSLTRAFAPILAKSNGGAVVNILSFLSLVTLPMLGTYSASKAAALALTRSLRAELSAQGTLVVASLPVQVDTAMGQDLPEPRLSPQVVASETLEAVEQGVDEVFPGDLSQTAATQFAANPKAVQAYMSTLLPA